MTEEIEGQEQPQDNQTAPEPAVDHNPAEPTQELTQPVDEPEPEPTPEHIAETPDEAEDLIAAMFKSLDVTLAAIGQLPVKLQRYYGLELLAVEISKASKRFVEQKAIADAKTVK